MFPTASSQIDYNEDGEVLGWDSGYGFEPEFDSADMYDHQDYDDYVTLNRECEHDDFERDNSGHAYCACCEVMLPELDD